MKNQLSHASNCLRTWKKPNVQMININQGLLLSKEEVDAILQVVKKAQHYEELAHIVAGLSGEILSELEFAFAKRDQKNIKEEIGDIQYFILILCNRLDIDITSIDESFKMSFSDAQVAKFCLDSPFKSVKYFAGETIDTLKKICIYKDPKKSLQDLEANVFALQASLCRLALKNGFSVEEAIEAVIAKLKERFKEKFTVEEVSERNLENEYKHL